MDTNEPKRPKGFQPGNKLSKGRPEGSRNAAQRVLDQIGLDNVQKVYEVILDQALKGDLNAAKLIIDKVLPNAKGQYIQIPLPALDTTKNIFEAQNLIIQSMANGEVALEDGEKFYSMIEHHSKTVERADSPFF